MGKVGILTGCYFMKVLRKNSRENGYKPWVQRCLGSFGWTSVSYDLSMVFKESINH